MAKPDAGQTAGAAVPSAVWMLPIARAIVAAITALVITFSPDHSAARGLAVFGCFAAVSAIVTLSLGVRPIRADRVGRSMLIAQAALSVVAAVVALVFAAQPSPLPALYAVIIIWALITGALELYSGLHARRTAYSAVSRDWMIAGTLTILLAVAYLLVPPGLNQQYGGIENVEGALTASVVVVGVLGAYAAILAVHFIIGGLSLKWASAPHATARRREMQR
ncbi:hypothetical protein [Okibacterium endophyticum]